MDNKKLLTLALIYDDNRVLLGRKKRGFGEGYWNGFGGKVNEGETIPDAAKREMQEESGVFVEELEERGVITFTFKGDPRPWEVHVFRVTKYTGEPHETEEMEPKWYLRGELPFDEMWQDESFWLPQFLNGGTIHADFLYEGNIILEKNVEVTGADAM